MSTEDARRPRRVTEGDEVRKAGGRSTAVDFSSTATDNVLITWPQSRWEDYLAGYETGYTAGVERGRQVEHDEVAAIQKASARVVHAMSKIEPRDPVADQAAAQRRDARFNGRRAS